MAQQQHKQQPSSRPGVSIKVKNGVDNTVLHYSSIRDAVDHLGIEEWELRYALYSDPPIVLGGLFEARFTNDPEPWVSEVTRIGVPVTRGAVYMHDGDHIEKFKNVSALRRQHKYTAQSIRKSMVSGGRLKNKAGKAFTADGVISRRPLVHGVLRRKVKAVNVGSCVERVASTVLELEKKVGVCRAIIYANIDKGPMKNGWVFTTVL